MLQIVDYLLLVLLRYQSPLVFWLSLLELLLLAGSKFDEVGSRSSKSRSTTLSKILNFEDLLIRIDKEVAESNIIWEMKTLVITYWYIVNFGFIPKIQRI